MTTSRSRPSETEAENNPVGDAPVDESPELNAYDINADRTVFTEPGNTDGWIASDSTMTPRR